MEKYMIHTNLVVFVAVHL